MKRWVVHLQKKSLKRALSALDLFAVGYGDVGSSIYYALGITALFALGATPIALLIAGFVFICTSLTYAEMATTFPQPGGSATYSRYAFNDLISFVAGWGLLLDYIVTIAISAFAIPPYLKYVFDLFSLPFPTDPMFQTAISVGLIAFLCILNVIGVRGSGRLSVILSLVSIISQVFVIVVAGVLILNFPYVLSHLKIGVPGTDWSPSWGEFMKGIAMAMVAYTGIEAISQLAAETRKPSLMIPRAIRWTMWTLVFLYFGISVVGLSVISPHELGTKYVDDPVAGIVASLPFGGQWLGPWFGLMASFILLIASNAGLLGCSRMMFSMGEYYQVPHFFYKLHPKFRTPYLSLAVFAILACIVLIVSDGQMHFMADLYNFGAQIAFFAAHMSLLVLRWKKPELKRPFLAPLNIPFGKNRSLPLTAILGAVATFVVWLIVIVTKPQGRYLGFTWILVGLAMYFYYRKKKQLPTTGQLTIEKIKVPEYKKMHLKNVLVSLRSEGNSEAVQTACQLAKNSKAKISAVYIMEVPLSLPMNAPLMKREQIGMQALKQAQAIAHEYGLTLDLQLIRSRSIEEALLEVVHSKDCDMLVLSAHIQHRHKATAEKLFKKAPCKVLFCKS